MVRGKALKEAEPEFSVLLNKKYAEKILQVCTYFYLCKYLADVLDQSRVCCSKLFHSVGPFEVCNLLLAWPFSYYVVFFFSNQRERKKNYIYFFSLIRFDIISVYILWYCNKAANQAAKRVFKTPSILLFGRFAQFGCLILQCWGCFKEGWLVGKFIVLYTVSECPK